MRTLRFAFLILLCLAFFSFVSAQAKPVAMKFDEFDDTSEDYLYPDEETNFAQRIERFIKEIKRKRGIKVYLIRYTARKTDWRNNYVARRLADDTSGRIIAKTNLRSEDIISIDGGYRERNSIEYWIAPKNAAPPKPTPTFDKSEAFYCPRITPYANGLSFYETKSVEFSVSAYDAKLIENLKFTWKVSTGKIVRGQGTNKIEVQLNDETGGGGRVTAFVEVDGLPYACEKVSFSTIEVGQNPLLIDSAGRWNFSDLAARIDYFITILQARPSLRAYVIIYAGRNEGPRDYVRAMTSVSRMLNFRGFDLSRVTIVSGGYREYNNVDMWVLPEGVEPPEPTPTVDERFIVTKRKSRSR